jgi:hypothetical protein
MRIPFKTFRPLRSPGKLAQVPTLFTFNHIHIYVLSNNVDSRKLSFSYLSSIPILMCLKIYESKPKLLTFKSIRIHNWASFIHSFNSTVLQQVRRLFQMESSPKVRLVLPLTISSILSSWRSYSSCLGRPLLLLFTSILSSIFPSIRVLEGSSYARCNQSN